MGGKIKRGLLRKGVDGRAKKRTVGQLRQAPPPSNDLYLPCTIARGVGDKGATRRKTVAWCVGNTNDRTGVAINRINCLVISRGTPPAVHSVHPRQQRRDNEHCAHCTSDDYVINVGAKRVRGREGALGARK